MGMTVGELKTMLEGLDEDMEIRSVSQPSWPFEYAIAGITTKRRAQQADNEANCLEDVPYDEGEEVKEEQDIAYIVEGEQLCYASRNLFDRAARVWC